MRWLPKQNELAVEVLNKLLLLPPNDYTQQGQEWIGVARERSGQPDKAKVEYDLYLRLYPDSAGAASVAQRLEGLSERRAQFADDGCQAQKRNRLPA